MERTALHSFAAAAILPGYARHDAEGKVVEIVPAEPCPDLLTEDEAVRYLRLTDAADPTQTLYRYRAAGLLRATQVGKWLRYRRSELERFLERQTETVRH
jgi:hypothetical protein